MNRLPAMGMHSLRFAGKNEYMADLKRMRELIPQDPYVALSRKLEKDSAKLAALEARELNLVNQLNPEDKAKAPKGLEKFKLKAELQLVKTRGWLKAVKGLGQYVVTAFKTGDDGTEKTIKPEVKAAANELREIKTRLDGEKDAAKGDWLKEFETQSGKLSADETYFISADASKGPVA